MRLKILFTTICVMGLSFQIYAQDLSITKQLKLNQANQEQNIVGTVKGYDSRKYTIKVKGKQTLTVDMKSDDVYFNVYSPYKDEKKDDAFFVSKGEGKHFKSALLKNGMYIIRVYLKDEEAKNDIKRIFEIHVGLK